MKWLKLVVVGGMLFFSVSVCVPGRAEASVGDWPLVSQVWKIGSCVVADSGKILRSAISHAEGFGLDVLKVVADCATFVVETITPGTIPDPHA